MEVNRKHAHSAQLKIIRIYHECEGRIEKSVPRDQRLSSFGKPRDAKRRSSGGIFLSYPHTNNGFFFSCSPLFLFIYFKISFKKSLYTLRCNFT